MKATCYQSAGNVYSSMKFLSFSLPASLISWSLNQSQHALTGRKATVQAHRANTDRHVSLEKLASAVHLTLFNSLRWTDSALDNKKEKKKAHCLSFLRQMLCINASFSMFFSDWSQCTAGFTPYV